ncbi:MAG: oligosaccharide flippase family protein [Halobacteriota archaeon]
MRTSRSLFAPGHSLIRKNLLANFAGKLWGYVIGLLFVPVYIRFLGLGAYGLVGFFVTLTSLFIILDLGFSMTINRELARLSADKATDQEQRDLVRSMEVVYWCIGAAIAAIVIILSSTLATNWLHSASYSPQSLQLVVVLIGITLACNWPLSLYYGGLMGLQKQVLMNGIDVVMSTARVVLVTLVIWLISPTIYAFFICQAAMYLLQTLVAAAYLWKQLPHTGNAPRARQAVFKRIWRFSAGVSGISILAVVLANSDKLLLSKVLPLSLFATYAIAASLAAVLSFVVAPTASAVFPALTKIVVEGTEEHLKELYHRSCQFLSVLVIPAAFIVVLFSSQILQIWIRDPVVTENAHLVASLLAIGTTLNAIVAMPYSLQLSYGWTRLGLYQNVIAVIAYIPLLLWLTSIYGAPGAAMAWIAVNCGYFLVTVPVMHRFLLKGELRRWYIVDVGFPFLGALVVAGLARIFLPISSSLLIMAFELFIVLILSWAAAAFATPAPREWILSSYRSLQQRDATQ